MNTAFIYKEQVEDVFVLKDIYNLDMLNKADIDGSNTVGGVWKIDTISSDLFSGSFKRVMRVLGGQMAIEYGDVNLVTHRFVADNIGALKLKVGSAEYTVYHSGNLTNVSQLNNDAGYLQVNDLDGFIYDVQYNSAAHTITFYQQNEPNIVIDLPIEQLIKGVQLVGNDLVFTFEDGSIVTVPLNTLLVGVVKSVNGKTPNSQGEIILNVTDIPNLSSELSNKLDIRMAGLVNNLTQPEKDAILTKLGVVNNIVQVLGLSGNTITLSNGGGSIFLNIANIGGLQNALDLKANTVGNNLTDIPQWKTSLGFLDASDLIGYATETWVNSNFAYRNGGNTTGGQWNIQSIVSSAFAASSGGNGQVFNTNLGTLYLGNPSGATNIVLETAANDLTHYRSDLGVGYIWDSHNFNPNNKANVDASNLVNIPNWKSVLGIVNYGDYRQWGLGTSNPNFNINIDLPRETGFYGYYSGTTTGTAPFGYATLIHNNFAGGSEFSQIAIQQGATGMAFRNESSPWNYVWHNNNLSDPATQTWVNNNFASNAGLNNKANIDGSNTIGGTWDIKTIISSDLASAIGNGQVFNTDIGDLWIGNPSVNRTIFETSITNDLLHYRGGLGNAVIWTGHNFDPANYALLSQVYTQSQSLALFVGLNGVQTIADTKTFTSSPIVPNGTLNGHAVNLGQMQAYVATQIPGNSGIETIRTDNSAFSGPAYYADLFFNFHEYWGFPAAFAEETQPGNATAKANDEQLDFFASYDSVHTMVETSGTADVDMKGYHIVNVLLQSAGGDVHLPDGVYAGDQINITTTPGNQINIYANNLIATTGNEVRTFANLVWDCDLEGWVMTAFGAL